jgi:hypothetical protein
MGTETLRNENKEIYFRVPGNSPLSVKGAAPAYINTGVLQRSTFWIAPASAYYYRAWTSDVILFIYNKRDENQKRRALACIRALISDAAKIGVGEIVQDA